MTNPHRNTQSPDLSSTEMEHVFRAAFENAPIGMWVSGMDKKLLMVNRALCRMLGFRAEDLVGRAWTEITCPEDIDLSLGATDTMLSDSSSGHREIEKRFVCLDGSVVWGRLYATLVRSSDGTPLYFTVCLDDISEQRRLDVALDESGDRFKLVADSCPSMMWVTDDRGQIQYSNRAMRAFCETCASGKNPSECDCLIHPADAPEYCSALQRAIAERTKFRGEARVRVKGDNWRLIGSTAEPCISSRGEYLGHVGVSADITDRVQREKERQFELSLIRSIHDQSLEGILVVNEAGVVVSANRQFIEICKSLISDGAETAQETVIGASESSLLLSLLDRVEDPDGFRSRVEHLYAHPDERDDCEIRLKDGRIVARRSAGLRDQADQYLGRVWFLRDITERRLAEMRLEEAKVAAEETNRRLLAQRSALESDRQILRALIDNVPDFMYVKDTQSRFIVANAYVARVLRLKSPDELVGKTDLDFYPPELARGFMEDEQAMMKSGRPLYDREESAFDETGRTIRILSTKVPVRDSEGNIIGLAGVGRNISARKQMEDALRDAERKYRGIFNNAIVGIFQSTPEGRFLSVNPALATMFGYESPEEMVWLITDLATQLYVDPKGREEFKARVALEGGVQNFEWQAVRKDGARIWLSMNVRAIFQDGQVIRYEGMCEEITERKLLRDQLLQAQKLESVGQLAAGIAHEINTPTQYIGDNTRFVKDGFHDLKELLDRYEALADAAKGSDCCAQVLQSIAETAQRIDAGFLIDEMPKAIDQTLEGISRVSALVSAMKEFSHPGTKEKIPIDLNHAIRSTITISRNEWKYVADLETDFDESLEPVLCLPAEFNQVILNLIVNATHAIGDVVQSGAMEKGKITIQTRQLAACAEIRITDTGTGIPDKIKNRVFDPFFTTKQVGKGTGQGLAIAHSVVVDKHGGTIRFESELGKGTTFILCLPISKTNSAPKDSIA